MKLPSAIARDIARGKLIRTGGVIRDTKGGIVTHLKDVGKFKKALKSPVIPLMLLDFAEGALLNRKLGEIQEQLSSVSQKVEQLQWAQVMLPFEKLSKLAHLESTADRDAEMRQLQDSVDAALVLARRRLVDGWKAADATATAYLTSSHRIPGSHRKALSKILSSSRGVVADAQLAVALLVLRARLHDELRQPRAAAAACREATEVAARALGRLNDILGRNSAVRNVDHIKTLFAKKGRIKEEVVEWTNEILRESGTLLSASLFQLVTQAQFELPTSGTRSLTQLK